MSVEGFDLCFSGIILSHMSRTFKEVYMTAKGIGEIVKSFKLDEMKEQDMDKKQQQRY